MIARKLAAIAAVISLVGLVAVGSAPWVHGPYSGAPSADSIVVSWMCEASVSARVEYSTLEVFEASSTWSKTVQISAPEDADSTCHAMLVDLEPGTDYVYRVVLCEGEAQTPSETGFFCTAPATGEPVSFAVLADTQWQSEGVNRLELVGDAIAADPAPFDFILHAGDVVESPSSTYWDHWFNSFDDMLRRAPFIPVLGNHEKNHRSYYEAFCLPPGAGKDNERWWALHWGDVVIVGLDSNVKKATDYAAQQEWSRTHLSGPEPHKFVIFHHPVFTSDAYHGSETFLDRIYHPIFVEMEVDIVFNGHSHHYEHIVRDGVTYLVVGGGGATPRRTKPNHIQGSDVSFEGHCFYTRVATEGDRIAVETLSVAQIVDDESVVKTGDVLDAFALPTGTAVPARGTPWRAVLIAAVGLLAAVGLVVRGLFGAR